MSRASTKESTDQKDLHAQRESGCLSKNEADQGANAGTNPCDNSHVLFSSVSDKLNYLWIGRIATSIPLPTSQFCVLKMRISLYKTRSVVLDVGTRDL